MKTQLYSLHHNLFLLHDTDLLLSDLVRTLIPLPRCLPYRLLLRFLQLVIRLHLQDTFHSTLQKQELCQH